MPETLLNLRPRALPSGSRDLVYVPVSLLQPADSPRAEGIDYQHVQLLAGCEDTLPPLLVHRSSMRVIDGMHRLQAARLRGEADVAVQFFDGDEAAAFVAGVTANITHGLPLSLADRKAAAGRIMRAYPDWSDRAVGQCTGISGKTVAALRQRAGADLPQPHTRRGRDGRVRPVDAARRRLLASEFITRSPRASLREIADAAGVSPTTARDVRNRMRRGDDPVPDRARTWAKSPAGAGPGSSGSDTSPGLLSSLQRDPSLRYTESGRHVLRWLHRHLVDGEEGSCLLENVSPHCLATVARLARHCALEWQSLADQLEQRLREIA